jgi:Glycosyltransferase
MKVLWINPSFLDYRIPLYSNLYHLLDKNFYLLFSQKRNPERVNNKIQLALGENAIGTSDEKTYTIGKKSDFANKYISIPYQKDLYKRIKNTNPDIIIAEGFFQWTPWAVFYAWKNKKPLYIAYERTQHTERNCPKWRSLYRKFISRFVSGFLANGIETLKYLEKENILKGKRVAEGCMCADSEFLGKAVALKTSEQRKQIKEQYLKTEDRGLVYLFVGQIIERKGVAQLLDAWTEYIKKYPKDSLLLVGGGPFFKKYSLEYKEVLGINFIGSVDYDQISDFYAIADVFILPTLEDNWSLVIPEAMACRLPITTTIYNGLYPDLVTKDNGFVFDSLKKESILEALEYFHKEGTDLKKMGEISFQIEQNYTPEMVAKRIINCIS